MLQNIRFDLLIKCMIKPSPCILCARKGPTCCQTGQDRTELGFPLSEVENEIISTYNNQKDICFTVRTLNSPQFISRLKYMFPKDIDRIQALYPDNGYHESLATDNQGRCFFLDSTGCLLPKETKPLYCRIFPFWVIGKKVGYFNFEICQAQKDAGTVQTVLMHFNMNSSQIHLLYDALRRFWGLDG
jgi:Fe-S-cluster containining protein